MGLMSVLAYLKNVEIALNNVLKNGVIFTLFIVITIWFMKAILKEKAPT